jgi:8-oxo-dGTP diphosphatase
MPLPFPPAAAASLPVTTDIVALTVEGPSLKVLLVTRTAEPFAGELALPGGFVRPGESLPQAAERELTEKTGVIPPGHLEQLGTYGPLGRDPRGPVLSVAYLLMAPSFDLPGPGGTPAAWHDLAAPGHLAFDHSRIVADAVERARAKLEYSGLATAFCGDEFTISELRSVYEAVWGTALEPRNFHRKATGTPGFIEPVGRQTEGGTGRPAAVFRLASGVDPAATVLNPPIMRVQS